MSLAISIVFVDTLWCLNLFAHIDINWNILSSHGILINYMKGNNSCWVWLGYDADLLITWWSKPPATLKYNSESWKPDLIGLWPKDNDVFKNQRYYNKLKPKDNHVTKNPEYKNDITKPIIFDKSDIRSLSLQRNDFSLQTIKIKKL